jgi:hypothetical protein
MIISQINQEKEEFFTTRYLELGNASNAILS